MSFRAWPTPYYPNKPLVEAAPPGPRVYAGRRRLRVEPTGAAGEFRLVDSEGRVHRVGAREEVEHHIGEQLRRGRYRVR